jgi:hypothetical protein
VKNVLRTLGAQVIEDFLGTGDVIAIVQASIHDGNHVAGGRVGIIEVVEFGVLIAWEGWWKESIRRTSAEERLHVAGGWVTLHITDMVWVSRKGRKKGRIGVGKFWV